MLATNEKTIIICGIVRNAAKGLRRNIPEIKRLCRSFRDYRVFVYENDSTDLTKQILTEWHESDVDRVMVSLHTTSPSATIPKASEVAGVNPFYSFKRIDRMARLRNAYMEYVDENGWQADYLMVVDLDVAWIKAENILTSFKKEGWDAVTAFGYSTSPKLKRRYHDTYALTEYGQELQPQTEHKIKYLANKYANLSPEDPWVRVFSAFGGVAVYRYECVKGLRYRVIPNSDPRVEVRCEHYSIYQQMGERGYHRVFINPAMIVKYQQISFKILYNSMLRRIKRIGGGNLEPDDLLAIPGMYNRLNGMAA